MRTKEFLMGYKVAKDKSAYCSKHIKTTYIPYVDKIATAKLNIVEPSTHKEVSGNKIFWRNTPVQALLFSLKLVDKYSDIEINPEKIYDEYDELVKVGALSDIIKAIPQNEVAEFDTVVKMVDADIEYNERSLPSWIENKVDALNIGLETILDVMQTMIAEKTIDENV